VNVVHLSVDSVLTVQLASVTEANYAYSASRL
jgi:hypothetical protein